MKHCEKCHVYFNGEHECAPQDRYVELAMEETNFDPVQRPAHYNQGGIETIDAIREALGAEGFKAYCLGNVIKYAWRQNHKGGAEDRAKCAWYARMASGDDPRTDA